MYSGYVRTSKSLEIWKSCSPACLMNAIFFFLSEDQNGKKIWASAFEWEVRGERFSSQWFEMKRISWQRKPRCGSSLLAVSFFNLKQMKSNERENFHLQETTNLTNISNETLNIQIRMFNLYRTLTRFWPLRKQLWHTLAVLFCLMGRKIG